MTGRRLLALGMASRFNKGEYPHKDLTEIV